MEGEQQAAKGDATGARGNGVKSKMGVKIVNLIVFCLLGPWVYGKKIVPPTTEVVDNYFSEDSSVMSHYFFAILRPKRSDCTLTGGP